MPKKYTVKITSDLRGKGCPFSIQHYADEPILCGVKGRSAVCCDLRDEGCPLREGDIIVTLERNGELQNA